MSDENLTSTMSAYVEGLLTPEEMQNFERLLAEDPLLAAAFNDYKELLESEKILKGSDWTTPQGFESRLFSKLTVEQQRHSTGMLARVIAMFEFLGRPTQIKVGLVATVFLLSFSVLLARNVVTTTPRSVTVIESDAKKAAESLEQSIPQEELEPLTHSAAPGAPSFTDSSSQNEDLDFSQSDKQKVERSQEVQIDDTHKPKKARSSPQVASRSLSRQANTPLPEFESASEGATAETIAGAKAPAAMSLSEDDSPTEGIERGVSAADGVQNRAVPQNYRLSEHASTHGDKNCQSQSELISLAVAERVFERPEKGAKIAYVTSKAVRGILCRIEGEWIGVRYLEDSSCPWAPHLKDSNRCPIGWIKQSTLNPSAQ